MGCCFPPIEKHCPGAVVLNPNCSTTCIFEEKFPRPTLDNFFDNFSELGYLNFKLIKFNFNLKRVVYLVYSTLNFKVEKTKYTTRLRFSATCRLRNTALECHAFFEWFLLMKKPCLKILFWSFWSISLIPIRRKVNFSDWLIHFCGRWISAIIQRIPPPPTCSMVVTSHSTKSTNFSSVERFSVDSRLKALALIARTGFPFPVWSWRQFPANPETSS